MTDLHARRLLKLADKMETVARKQFNIQFWMKSIPECGTVGCVLGYACTIPAFKARGLRLVSYLGSFVPVFNPRTRGERQRANELYRQSFGNVVRPPRGFEDFHAGMTFFGLTFRESARLFSASGYEQGYKVTPKQVAARIRKFVREKQKAAAIAA